VPPLAKTDVSIDLDVVAVHTAQRFFGAAATAAVLAASTGARARAPDIGDAHRLDTPNEAIVETTSGRYPRVSAERRLVFKGLAYGEDTRPRTASCAAAASILPEQH
jgi:hypothetical protein